MRGFAMAAKLDRSGLGRGSRPGNPLGGRAQRRSFGCAPNDKPETGALSAAYPTQAQRQGLNGAPNLRCWCRRQGLCSLNLPQASRLLGMTRGSAPGFPVTQYSLTATCAAFGEASRMKFANATKFDRKSGVA